MTAQLPDSVIYKERAELYDLVYAHKDYEHEATVLKDIIHKLKLSSGKELLDVGCGTGKHIAYLIDSFDVSGVDVNAEILALSQKRFNGLARFFQQDMANLDLPDTYDVILCLFSSIGYVQTEKRLRDTLRSFSRLLKPGGVIIIEPWLSTSEFQPGRIDSLTYDTEEIKLTRMSLSKLENGLSVTDMHYLLAVKGKDIEYLHETHKLGLFDNETICGLLEAEQLHVEKKSDYFSSGRPLIVAQKPL